MKPKVAFIGTGGTIASVGTGPLDLQNYGATGKVMHRHQFSGCGHILSKKTRKRKRNFRKDQPTFKGDLKRLAPTIPYLV